MQAVIGKAASAHAVIDEIRIARGHKSVNIISGCPEVGQIAKRRQFIGYSIQGSVHINLGISLL